MRNNNEWQLLINRLGIMCIVILILAFIFEINDVHATEEQVVEYNQSKITKSINLVSDLLLEQLELLRTHLIVENNLIVEDNSISVTDYELEILHRITEAESQGEGVMGKMMVASVILNRVSSDDFKNDIESVVFREINGYYQFSPIMDGRYWSVEITDETILAVDSVLIGEFVYNEALFFNNKNLTNSWASNNREFLETWNNHTFYK